MRRREALQRLVASAAAARYVSAWQGAWSVAGSGGIALGAALGATSAQAGAYDDFFHAVRMDDVQTVDRLLARGFDPNTPYEDFRLPVMMAVQEESAQVLERLVKVPGIQLNKPNSAGETPLMLAALKGRLYMVQALLHRSGMEKALLANRPGWAPLHYAAAGGHADITRELLDVSAYIDAEAPDGSTPLIMAARFGNARVVKILLEEGADPTLKAKNGQTALDAARAVDREDSARIIEAFVRTWGR